jgi:hypothetical protein
MLQGGISESCHPIWESTNICLQPKKERDR